MFFFAEGDWSIHVSTVTELKDGDVALVAYGDRGGVTENSGPIILGAPPGRPIFQDGNEDEFRVCNFVRVKLLFILHFIDHRIKLFKILCQLK